MDHANRDLVRQLADDLSWLEDHCRKQPDLVAHTLHLRLAGALTRNVVGPAVDGLTSKPLFLAVVGGAGAGKSTVVNFLLGSVVAEANPQAGYTRHPTAFLPSSHSAAWPAYLGFLGPLQRLSQQQPANLDEDVYQVRRVGAPTSGGLDPLSEFVVWDCPDMTTWASSGYISRLMEVIGLADVIVYVASDERYNDEVPTQYLQHIAKAGKAVICCITKVREADAEALAEHFRREVLGRLPQLNGASLPPVVTLPQMSAAVRRDPAGQGAKYRVELLNQILALCPTADETRQRTIKNAVVYLDTAANGLVDVARRDLAELDAWRSLVAAGRAEFELRYRTEFLTGESFRRFDRTREQVLAMLDLPGPGKSVSAGFTLLRLPYTYARDFLVKVVVRPPQVGLPEQVVCSTALSAWLDGLQAEALRRSATHPLWKQITHGFDSGLKSQAHDRFGQVFRSFELKETDELDQAARAVPERLSKNTVLLTGLRLSILALDFAAIGLVLWLTIGPNWNWYHLLLIPLAVSITRQVVELLVRGIVDTGRNRLRSHRESLVHEHLSAPLASWLSSWPTSGGSSLERLQTVLRRVPQTIRDLAAKLSPPEPPPPPAPASP